MVQEDKRYNIVSFMQLHSKIESVMQAQDTAIEFVDFLFDERRLPICSWVWCARCERRQRPYNLLCHQYTGCATDRAQSPRVIRSDYIGVELKAFNLLYKQGEPNLYDEIVGYIERVFESLRITVDEFGSATERFKNGVSS